MFGCLLLAVAVVLLAPIFFVLLYFQVVTLSFRELGLSPTGAFILFAASLIGGTINIPISRRPMLVEPPRLPFGGFLFYYPPRVFEQVIAVNVGGAVIPVLFSAYLLPTTPLVPMLLTLGAVTFVCKAVARPTPGVGITMPAFVAPLATVGIALLVSAPGDAPRVAYIGGTLGTLLGADILNLAAIRRMPATMLSIGGAGVFDGVFLVGVLAALLA